MSKSRKSSSKKQRRKTRKPTGVKVSPGVFRAASRKQVTIGIGLIAVAIILLLVLLISGGKSELSVEELKQRARQNLMLGRLGDAIADYHRALNEEPDNTTLQHERFLAESQGNFYSGGDTSIVIAAAQRIIDNGDYPLLGSVSLAQVLQRAGRASGGKDVALRARQRAQALGDVAAQIATNEVLSSFYRSRAQFDSAFFYSNDAIQLASAIDDTFHLAIARVTAGVAALRTDSLEFAYANFHRLREYRGISEQEFIPVANIYLADYFERSGQYDSALHYLGKVEDRYEPGDFDALAATALQILARTQCGLEEFEQSEEHFRRSLELARQLGNIADAIDVMNDMADCYRTAKDWFNARKYYMAAGNLAERFDFKQKDMYTADLNVRFLKELSNEEYRRAGEEGLELAAQFNLEA